MPKKDPRVDAYIAKAAPFARPMLKQLRKMVHAGCPDVQETIRWGMPHFEYDGLLCGMAAFKNHCALWFWNRELVLGANSERGMAQFGRIESINDLPDEKILIGYVHKAAAINQAGIKRPARSKPKKKLPPKVPDYFKAALAKNAKARGTFENFSPSQRKEYVEWVSEAKRDETRQQRVKMSILWLAEGKPRNWKYMAKWK
ncbi:MAG: YdeI/OmpD-associated family protein [Chthoniobacterales bacterium]